MTTALDGVKVLDLSRVLAGPYCTMLLGDLGAEIIKVERPGTGDDTRRWGPPFAGDDAAYFHSVNRNKRSLALDLTQPAGRDVLDRLVPEVDVVVHNFQPAVAERLGVGHARLTALHPRLVYCAISSFGPGGPDADRPGYDVLVQAMGGLMDITGDPSGPPTKVGVAIVDVVTGLFAMGGILAALRARDASGEGQKLDVALQDCLASALVNQAQNYLVSGVSPRRMGNAHPNLVPYQPFAAADGWLVVAGGNDAMFRRLVEALDRAAWADDPRFIDNAARVANREVLVAQMEQRIGEASVDHWLQKLTAAGVPAGPIRDVGTMLDSPHMRQRGMVAEVEHPTAGRLEMVRNPLHLEPAKTSVRRAPPQLGEHTEEVLRELLAVDDARLASWRRDGAFGTRS